MKFQGAPMKKIGSWVNNMTTWFQTKRNQERTAQNHNVNEQANQAEVDPLSRRILEIMHRTNANNNYGPTKPPTKPNKP